VAGLAAGPQLGQRSGVDTVLRLDEALQSVGIRGHPVEATPYVVFTS
jgi:hypothetical protein